ncbi:MAG: OmpA family protein [Chlorobium sp.]|jgi:outer membrane protein OmpA-like peptidoglycan-associated protein|nr:OmpA family protein [Chlorobium sp.]
MKFVSRNFPILALMTLFMFGQLSSAFAKQTGSNKADIVWNRYDFVPGDKIIFEDNQETESNGEFPSKWELVDKDNIEIATVNGNNVLYFIKCNMNSGGGLVPRMKNTGIDYLPDEFTVEFDAYFENSNKPAYYLYLTDTKHQRKLEKTAPSKTPHNHRNIQFDRVMAKVYGGTANYYPGMTATSKLPSMWRHFAISYNKGYVKVYIDDARVLTIPDLGYNPTGISIGSHITGTKNKGYIKNVRIAAGSVKLYNSLMAKGRIATTGIKFDTGNATLKPESNGVINEIVKMMNTYPIIRLRIEGHTDSDGDTSANQILSEKRSAAVKAALIKRGIAAVRLSISSFGETKPVADNTTSEGKANNRRVEFVKL